MLSVEIEMPSCQQAQFNEEANVIGLKCTTNLIYEVRDNTHAQNFAAYRETKRQNFKLKSIEMQEGDLVLQEAVLPIQQRKMQANQEGPYCRYQKLPHEAYQLQELEGPLLPRHETLSIFNIIIVKIIFDFSDKYRVNIVLNNHLSILFPQGIFPI